MIPFQQQGPRWFGAPSPFDPGDMQQQPGMLPPVQPPGQTISAGAQPLSPEDVARRQALAKAMQGGGLPLSQVQSPLGAVAYALHQGVEGYTQNRADEADKQQKSDSRKALMEALNSQDPLSALLNSQDPQAQDMAAQLKLGQIQHPQEKFEPVDQNGDGKPDFMRSSLSGAVQAMPETQADRLNYFNQTTAAEGARNRAMDLKKLEAAKVIDPTYLDGVVNYETDLPSPRDPKYLPTLTAARAADPSYDPSFRKQISTVRQSMITGDSGKSLNRVNTAVQHLDLLVGAAKALENNQDPRSISWIKNAWRTEFGSEVPTNFEAIARTAAGEVAAAILPGGGSVDEREGFAKEFVNSASQKQLSGAITSRIALMGGKIDGTRQQFISAFPPAKRAKAAEEFDNRFLLPHTREVVQRANQTMGIGEGGGNQPAPLVKTQQEFDALPSGATYTEPDGKQYRKP